MQGKVEKKAVIIHESDCQAIQKFPKEEWGKLARLIVRHGTSGGVVDKLSAEQRIALQPILDGIDTEKRRYQNVQYLQHLIDGVKKRAVSIPKTNENGKENSDYKAIDNLVKVLQRMIVDCREHDRLTEHVITDVQNLIKGDAKIRNLLGYKEITADEIVLYAKLWSAKYVGVQNYYDVET